MLLARDLGGFTANSLDPAIRTSFIFIFALLCFFHVSGLNCCLLAKAGNQDTQFQGPLSIELIWPMRLAKTKTTTTRMVQMATEITKDKEKGSNRVKEALDGESKERQIQPPPLPVELRVEGIPMHSKRKL